MKGLTKAQPQLLDAETGEYIEDVNIVTDAECVTYTNKTPMVSALGGIPAGTTFDNVPVEEVLNNMLYPYTKPTIALTANPAGGVREKGASLADIVLTASVTRKSEDIAKVEFLKDSTVIGTVSSPKAAGGQEVYTYAGPVTADCTIKARVTDKKSGSVDSSGISYAFVYPIYIGALAANVSSPTSDQIKALEKRVVKKASQQYTYTIADKRMCIACPPGMTLSKILDPNGFDSTASFSKSTVAVTGLDGTAQNYTVYIGGVTTQSNYKMSFNI